MDALDHLYTDHPPID